MSLHSLPLFVRLAGRPVILLGEGDAAAAKQRLLERAGAAIVGEQAEAVLAFVAIEDAAEADAAVGRLKARGVLVNAVDRPELCDFTLPAIVDRAPVIVAIGTGGASAGLAAALRQRLEALLPAALGGLAAQLHEARDRLRAAFPDPATRRRALAAALAPGGAIDPFGRDPAIDHWLADGRDDLSATARAGELAIVRLRSPDPDELTLRAARALAAADRVCHAPGVPPAILDRARADAVRIACAAPPAALEPGLTVYLEMT